MKVYNTLSAREEVFTPQDKNIVKMYVCGITPYDEMHLGHGRCYVVFDVLRRYLQFKGYKINYVQNFTDIDDKILNRAKELNKHPSEIVQYYISSYYEIERKLNITPANVYPKVTEHIDDIIVAVEKLVKKEVAYVTDTGVYFDINKFKNYGKLSKKKLDELISGARVEIDETKKSPLDFALWKFMKPDEPIHWNSPWGKGRPGWHIECSVMSMKYLGETLDIHGGGMDLIFPHHENEIAQSESLTGKQFVNYWVHNGFVTINKQKMSKSLKNIFALNDIFNLYEPMVVRLFLISQHYQKPLDFSLQEVEQFKPVYAKIINALSDTDLKIKYAKETHNGVSEILKKEVEQIMAEFDKSLADNLNTSRALSSMNSLLQVLFKLDNSNKQNLQYALSSFTTMLDVLGIKVPLEQEIPKEIQNLVEQRELARKNKDFATADKLRQEIISKGYIIEDTPYGPRVKKNI